MEVWRIPARFHLCETRAMSSKALGGRTGNHCSMSRIKDTSLGLNVCLASFQSCLYLVNLFCFLVFSIWSENIHPSSHHCILEACDMFLMIRLTAKRVSCVSEKTVNFWIIIALSQDLLRFLGMKLIACIREGHIFCNGLWIKGGDLISLRHLKEGSG